MAKFTDEKGQDWDVRITALVVDAFEGATGDSFFGEAASGKVRMRTAWRLTYAAVRKLAAERGMKSYEEWLEGIGKSAIGPMTTAAMTEIQGFFPAPGGEADNEARPTEEESPGSGNRSTN